MASATRHKQATESGTIVLFDDDPATATIMRQATARVTGVRLVILQESHKVLPYLQHAHVFLVFLALRLSQTEALLAKISQHFSNVPVVVILERIELERVVACMKQGAHDILVKPLDAEHVYKRIATFQSRRIPTPASPGHEALRPFSAILTQDPRMFAIFQYLTAVADSRQPVLVQGETGVGKELMAQAIHQASGLKGPLVAVNVAGIDGNLFSDTLFGHVRGAYSGAEQQRQGLVAEAQGGTLFLDEIGDLSPDSQVKLLRLLQEKVYYPLGSDQTRSSDARLVCATNVHLKTKVDEGVFRADLYYRLVAHHVIIPPLRERRGDIALLTRHFIASSARALNKPIPEPDPDWLASLESHPFPGNLRELQALVHDAMVCHTAGALSGTSSVTLPGNRAAVPAAQPWQGADTLFATLADPLPTFREMEEQLLLEALHRCDGRQGKAAARLGLSRTALNRRIQALIKKNR
ncbi:MAG: sigma-54-dependent Fis family transcriptional regulator [Magnetococcales bacterium]|nr:sigma-54-dependent Fis family transcriptional regulator [Magnetococcales bacterium]